MDKNIADVNAWLTKKISVFKPSKESERLLIRIPRRMSHRSEIPRRTDIHQKAAQERDENALKNKDELDHYKLRAKQLRDEFNALYKDLVTLRRDRSKFYESFAKQNVDALVQMIYEMRRAEDEITSLEEEIVTAADCRTDKDAQKREKKPVLTREVAPLKEVLPPKEATPPKDVESIKASTEKAVIRSQHEEAQEVLKNLKEITGKLKEQLASVHNYLATINQRANRERHGDQPQVDIKKERLKRYDCLLKDLGIKPH